MDAAAIEEANRMRATLGLKPLPVPGKAPDPDATAAAESDEDAPSTLESRQAKSYDNYQKAQEAEAAKRKREEKAAAVKKARDAAKRFSKLEGKGFGDDEDADVDAKTWLVGQKKRQKKIEKAVKTEQELAVAKAKADAQREYGSKDLAGIKVSHDISSFAEGGEQVLTLKDTTIQENEDEGDELEAFSVREKEQLTERLDLKKKKPAYNPYEEYEEGETSILGHYDEEISGKKKKKLFTLDAKGTVPEIDDILAAPAAKKREAVNIDDVLEAVPSSDYLDIKVKKPKKKKSKATRQKQVDADDILFPEEAPAPAEEEMDIDSGAGSRKKRKVTEDIIDDEDLQASLAIQRKNALKKRKKARPEDLARQLRQEATSEAAKEEEPQGGLVIDDISEFVTGLKKPEEEEQKPKKARPQHDESVTAMDLDSDDDGNTVVRRAPSGVEPDNSDSQDGSAPPDVSGMGVEEEKTVSQGIGATLGLLKERGLVKETKSAELNDNFRQHQIFLAEKRRRIDEFEEEARRQRERDRASGKLDRMTQREREEYARQQNTYRDQQTARIMNDLFRHGYRPQVELKYTDEHGRRLNEKEAFKHLSHQFHGKGSGKGKTDKMLKRIEDEKRRESQSMLDASQNVGMSSATAQQLKKMKEAGVRLA